MKLVLKSVGHFIFYVQYKQKARFGNSKFAFHNEKYLARCVIPPQKTNLRKIALGMCSVHGILCVQVKNKIPPNYNPNGTL
ncbi:hypothetical protein FKM82_000637 [Ascaphus truei]